MAPGQDLLERLRDKIVNLASESGIPFSVQATAQATLKMGWSLLLPTPDERAKALSILLQSPPSCELILGFVTFSVMICSTWLQLVNDL